MYKRVPTMYTQVFQDPNLCKPHDLLCSSSKHGFPSVPRQFSAFALRFCASATTWHITLLLGAILTALCMCSSMQFTVDKRSQVSGTSCCCPTEYVQLDFLTPVMSLVSKHMRLCHANQCLVSCLERPQQVVVNAGQG